jgi:hypothetical protein
MEKIIEVSHRMKVDAAVSTLVSAQGDAKARRRAILEQHNARRARSRRRYEFWVAVAAGIDAQRSPG